MANAFPIGWSNYDDYAREAAQETGISPAWFTQLLHNENASGNPSAKNPYSSATGLGQFITSTGLDFQTPDGQPFDRTNPFQSIDAAAIYVSDLYNKFLGKGQTSDQAYASAAKAYGDTASNNPAASVFSARLQGALYGESLNTSSDALSNFGLGLQTIATDPGTAIHVLGQAATTNPLGIVTSGGATVAATGASAAASTAQATASAFAPVLKLASDLTSGSIWERVALVILGIALIIVALTALGAKPLAGVASRLPPVIPV